MRNLKAYLNRRRIKDLKSWALQNNIFNEEDLNSFCASKELMVGNAISEFTFFKELSKEEKPSKVSPTNETTENASDAKRTSESWHTPAALRPLRKATPEVTSSSARKKTRKPRSRKGTVKAEE